MAVSKAENQVTWSAANNLSVTAGSAGTSDAVTLDGTSFAGSISCKADNNGTPTSGDKVEFYALYTNGDPDGTSTDEYDSNTQGTLLCILDTNLNDPAQATIPIQVSSKGLKVYAVNKAASNAITVSATIYESKA